MPVRMAIIKKSTNSKTGEIVEKRELFHRWWECKLIQPLWKTVYQFLKTLGIKPAYDPAIPLLGIYPEETKIEKDTCIPLLIAALFTIARTWKQLRCPSIDEWIKKLWYNGILWTMLVVQSCSTLWDPMNCSPQSFPVHRILQTRILEWISIPFSRRTSQPRDQTLVSCLASRFFTVWATGKSPTMEFYSAIKRNAFESILMRQMNLEPIIPSEVSQKEKYKYCMKVKATQSCLTLCDPMIVHGILQAKILEWVSLPFSRGSSQPRDRTQVSHIAGRFFTSWATRKGQEYWHV